MMSDIQRLCIIEATIAPLVQFRSGFARSKVGPFFYPWTVKALLTTGALRYLRSGGNKRVVTARAA